MSRGHSSGFGPTECGDDLLIGYDCQARYPDGRVDAKAIREPLAGSDGPRAIVQFIEWRRPHAAAGANISFRCVWLPRPDAIAQGYITGKDGGS